MKALTFKLFVSIYNQVPIEINLRIRKLMEIREASSGVPESTPKTPIKTGYKGGK